MILNGSFKNQVDAHLTALNIISSNLLPEHRKKVDVLMRVRRRTPFSRLLLLQSLGLQRESSVETVLLKLLFVFGLY